MINRQWWAIINVQAGLSASFEKWLVSQGGSTRLRCELRVVSAVHDRQSVVRGTTTELVVGELLD